MTGSYSGDAVITGEGVDIPVYADLSGSRGQANGGVAGLDSWGGTLTTVGDAKLWMVRGMVTWRLRLEDGREGRFNTTGRDGEDELTIQGSGSAPFDID